jgi:hypothetical protein
MKNLEMMILKIVDINKMKIIFKIRIIFKILFILIIEKKFKILVNELFLSILINLNK